jgi:hypothetical protein
MYSEYDTLAEKDNPFKLEWIVFFLCHQEINSNQWVIS